MKESGLFNKIKNSTKKIILEIDRGAIIPNDPNYIKIELESSNGKELEKCNVQIKGITYIVDN